MSTKLKYIFSLCVVSTLLLALLVGHAASKHTLTIKRMSVFQVSNEKATQIYLHLSDSITKRQVKVSQNKSKLTFTFQGAHNNLNQKRIAKVHTKLIQRITVSTNKYGTTLTILFLKPVNYKLNLLGPDVNILFESKAAPLLKQPSYKHGQYQSQMNKSVNSYHIQNVTLRKNVAHSGADLIITTSDINSPMTTHKKNNTLRLNFKNTTLSKTAQKQIKALRPPYNLIKKISAYSSRTGASILITGKSAFHYMVNRFGNKVVLDIYPVDLGNLSTLVREPSLTSKQKKLSLNFQNIKVRSLLQLIAKFTGINIVVSDAVQGTMSVHLNDLPWDQVLDIVLKSQGLAKRRVGNVLMIAPQEEVMQRELQELKASQQTQHLAPVYSETIHLHYAKATDLAMVLKDKNTSLLSARGHVSVDPRTNTLWIKDTTHNISEIRHFIQRLDVPVQQVLIEARIVNMDRTFERELGVKFGLTSGKHVSGTLKGANELFLTQGAGSAVPVADRLNFDLGAKGFTGVGAASIGLALFKVAKNTYLDLELSALEQEGLIHVISSPRLITSNQKTATIEAGEEIPYEEKTSSGATSIAFKKAVLALNITPQITPNNKIILDLKINEDRTDKTFSVKEQPAIKTQKITTQVLLNDGETIVLGGIYKQNKRNITTRVPFFGSIPIVGALFRHKSTVNNHFELLIFITPRVLRTTV